MGYDTSAYIKVNKKNEIAYLRRSMWGWEDMLILYQALGIEDKFQRISGHGDEIFKREIVEKAFETLKNSSAPADLAFFLEETLIKTPEDQDIEISFA